MQCFQYHIAIQKNAMLSIPYSNTESAILSIPYSNTEIAAVYGSNKEIAAMYRHNFTALLYCSK